MNTRQIRENLGRVKTSFQRNELPRALNFFIAGLRGLDGGAPPTDIRGDIREAVQLLLRDEKIKALLPSPNFSYTPGQEKNLLTVFIKISLQLQEIATHEEHNAALERKIKLDRAFLAGKNYLGQRRISEADASFVEALQYYKDEHRIFYMIAHALVELKEVVRAGPYLKKGLEALPGDTELLALLERARTIRQEMKAGK